MLVLQLLWYNPCATEVCNTTSSLPRPLHWSIVVDHREHWTATLSGPSGAVPTWPDGAWLDGLLLTEPLSPPWDMSFESASLNIWSRLWHWMVGQSSKHFAKKQKAINMPKFPVCKAACDNSAHQCLSGESFLWSSGQPMVFLSIQSLEPLQSFFWDRLAEFIVWSATAETQNTSKYNPWKLVHRLSVVASWEPAKKRLGPNAQVAQPANGIR